MIIIIPSLNIAIEVSRDLHDLEDYEEKAFEYLTSEEFDEGIDYEIKSEYNIDKEKLEQEGYKIIWR